MKTLTALLVVVLCSDVFGDFPLTSPHLIGGDDVRPFNRPYSTKIELRTNGKLVKLCGAAQIHREWFLTAAECVDGSKYNWMTITIPHFNDNVEVDVMNFSYHKIHPEYNEKTKENNIAILRCKVCKRFYTENLPHLPSKKEKLKTFLNVTAVVSGWINRTDSERLVMTSMDTNVIDFGSCKIAYPLRSLTNNQHICTSGSPGKGLSEDDVGAPLAITEGKITKLIGIGTDVKSFDKVIPMPMVFTRVSPYVEWIHNETNIPVQE